MNDKQRVRLALRQLEEVIFDMRERITKLENERQPAGNACTNCWGSEVDAAGNPCPHPGWKRPND